MNVADLNKVEVINAAGRRQHSTAAQLEAGFSDLIIVLFPTGVHRLRRRQRGGHEQGGGHQHGRRPAELLC